MQVNKIQLLKKGIRIFLLVFMAANLWYCANVVAPKGGPKDETPPRLLLDKSSPNMQTNFTIQDINLEFDEWVELNDVFNQIVISPPVDRKDYEVKIKGRSIVFHFKETATLRENVTYTINFGEAVRDITERNPAENLRYVFSTGSVIDSLTVSGQVLDARTKEPVKDAFFMLYENLADSVVRTENPFYFGKTNEAGSFLIENVRAGTFKGFAIKRVDQNYKYDNPAELIGFPDDFIIVGDTTNILPDSTGKRNMPPVKVPTILLFQERLPLYISKVDSARYGYLNLTFNAPPGNITLEYSGLNTINDSPPQTNYEADSLHIWYDQSGDNAWQLIVRKDSLLNDTIPIKALDRSNFLNSGTLKYIPGISTKPGKLNPSFPIEAGFSRPLSTFDTAFMRLLADTALQVIQPVLSIDSTDRRKLLISSPWKASLAYSLNIFPGGVEDMFGLKNKDTLQIKYIADQKKAYGNIKISISGLQDSLSYFGELLDKNEKVLRAFSVTGTQNFELSVNALSPGDYHIKIVTDLNKNGVWDTGSYNDKRQPEPIHEKVLEKLRANWDVETSINLEEG